MEGFDDQIWRGEVSSELRHIVDSVRGLERQLHALDSRLLDELAAHRDYHSRNEHRWGFVKWCQVHPFRFAALAGVAIACLARRDSVLVGDLVALAARLFK